MNTTDELTNFIEELNRHEDKLATLAGLIDSSSFFPDTLSYNQLRMIIKIFGNFDQVSALELLKNKIDGIPITLILTMFNNDIVRPDALRLFRSEIKTYLNYYDILEIFEDDENRYEAFRLLLGSHRNELDFNIDEVTKSLSLFGHSYFINAVVFAISCKVFVDFYAINNLCCSDSKPELIKIYYQLGKFDNCKTNNDFHKLLKLIPERFHYEIYILFQKQIPDDMDLSNVDLAFTLGNDLIGEIFPFGVTSITLSRNDKGNPVATSKLILESGYGKKEIIQHYYCDEVIRVPYFISGAHITVCPSNFWIHNGIKFRSYNVDLNEKKINSYSYELNGPVHIYKS